MAKADYIRAHKGWLQTAFLSLRKDQREIALLATVDVAPEDYFKRVADQIKRREKRGFAIVYDYGGEADQLEPSRRAVIDALGEHGFVYLRDSLPVEDYWINAGHVGEPDAADPETGASSEINAINQTSSGVEELAATLLSGQLPNPMHDIAPSPSNKSAEERNEHTVEVIKQQAEHYHVYVFLGANRVGDIVEGLFRTGFELGQTHWMDVMAVEHGRPETKATIDYRRQ
jgi:hypothetical protein